MAKWVCMQDCVWGPAVPEGKPSMSSRWRVGQVYTGAKPQYKNRDGELVDHPYFKQLRNDDDRDVIDPIKIFKATLDDAGIEYDDDTWTYYDYENAAKGVKRKKTEAEETASIKKDLTNWGVRFHHKMKLTTLKKLHREAEEEQLLKKEE